MKYYPIIIKNNILRIIMILFLVILNFNITQIHAILEKKHQDVGFYNIFHNKPSLKLKNNHIETMYNYNQEAQLIEKKNLKEDKDYLYHYNVKDQIISKTLQQDQNFLNTYEYNDKNQLKIVKNSENQIQTKYKYNRKGQLIKKINFCLYDTPCFYKSVYTYKYNDQNQKIKKIYYGVINKHPIFKCFDKLTKINNTVSIYRYNQKQQLISKIDKQGQEYTYKYYNFIQESIL
ncbi:hypothetical protein [Candidatus Phytoplasma meliae]|uniref:Uncharacterized protein n=1 Tax=Candidatus Phytoplasma meliae TaxID=1848402 RepID=A0ABS5CYS4_9MOLU|nr:hypothetical protein [Candidatus Phytoplasma meliae]MBP5836132.1 hypothetical protein [Candidatus Phytoplasma meliae]